MKKYPHKIIDVLQIKKTKKFSVIDINFDEAHDEWTKNKIKGKNGTYSINIYTTKPVLVYIFLITLKDKTIHKVICAQLNLQIK